MMAPYGVDYVYRVNSTKDRLVARTGKVSGRWYYYEVYTTAFRSETKYEKGSYLGEVFSTSSSIYPEDGISGDYWYVKQ